MNQSDNTERKTYDVPQVARLLGIGRNCAYDAVNRGEIRGIRIGGRLVVPKSEVDRLLAGEPAARA